MENANGDDWREELYLKVRSLKEMSLPHLSELYKTTEDKLQHQESLLPQKRSDDEFEKLKRLKRTLERMIYFVSLPKSKILPDLKDNIASCEKQIMDLLKMHGPRQLPQSQTIHGMQQNTSSSIPGSRLELGQGSGLNNGNGGDWQEQAFQKIQSLKAMHLAELNEIYQRFAMKVQQHRDSSIPQQQRSVEFEKMIKLKTMVERLMEYLSVPKTKIMPILKDKMDFFENWIIDFLNRHRVRNTVQLPQSQTIPDQTNPRMKSMSMQNNVVSSLPRVSAPQQIIPSFLLASSRLESGQGQQVLAMGSMQQNTSQQVNNSSAQSGLWTLHSNVNQTILIQLHEQQQDKQLMQLQQKFQYRQMQQQELLQLLQQQQMPQQMTQEIKQQFQYRQMQQLELLQRVNKLQQHLLARQQDQQMRQQQQPQMQQQRQQHQMQQLNQKQMQQQRQQQQMQLQRQQHQMLQQQPQPQPQMQQLQQQQTQQQRQQQQMQQLQQKQTQQQRQQHPMQQQQPQMLPASNLEPDQGSGLNNANGSDLQEEIIQKFKYMKETYLADVKELYDRVVETVQQDPLPPQERSDQYEKQKEFKIVLEYLIRYLSGSKRDISPASKDKMDYIESQIILYLSYPSHRPARQRQLPQT